MKDLRLVRQEMRERGLVGYARLVKSAIPLQNFPILRNSDILVTVTKAELLKRFRINKGA